MINTETKDLMLDYCYSMGVSKFYFSYDELNNKDITKEECEFLLDSFEDKGLIISGTSYKLQPTTYINTIDLIDLKNAGGFARKEKINEAEVEKLFGELIKLQKSHPELEYLNSIISSISGLTTIMGL